MEQSQLSKGSFGIGFFEEVCAGAVGAGGWADGVDAGGGALAAAAPAFAELVGALGGGVFEDLASAATALVAGGVEDGIAVKPALAGGLDEHATRIVRVPDTIAQSRR